MKKDFKVVVTNDGTADLVLYGERVIMSLKTEQVRDLILELQNALFEMPKIIDKTCAEGIDGSH